MKVGWVLVQVQAIRFFRYSIVCIVHVELQFSYLHVLHNHCHLSYSDISANQQLCTIAPSYY